MKQIFSPKTLRTAILILGISLIVKLLWMVVEVVWLPTSGVEYKEDKTVKNLYYRVSFVSTNAMANKPKAVIQVQGSIKDIKLLAVYSATAKAVVAVAHKGKITVLASGDEINGFVLDSAGMNYATFVKDEKIYKVELEKKGSQGFGNSSIHPRSHTEAVIDQNKPSGEITDAGDRKIVDRSLISHYATNMDAIFNDIGIEDIKENGEVKGFKVGFIREGSNFSQLGLKRGDVIKAVNGQEMNNYSAAFGVYKDIGNIDNLTMVIQRDNKEMELEYEVN